MPLDTVALLRFEHWQASCNRASKARGCNVGELLVVHRDDGMVSSQRGRGVRSHPRGLPHSFLPCFHECMRYLATWLVA